MFYSGIINISNPIAYFTYFPSISETDDDIEFTLMGPHNKLVLLVNNDGSIPDLKDNGFHYISHTGHLFLNHSKTKSFVYKANYTIAVVALDHSF